MARGQQQDIQGFRRSHKKIPTRQAMLDDQEELKAKQKAVASMGQGGAAKAANQGPRKPLSSYQNQMNPIGFGGLQPPDRPEQPKPTPQAPAQVGQTPPLPGGQIGTPGSLEQAARGKAVGTLANTIQNQGLSADATYGSGNDSMVNPANVDVVAAANQMSGLNVFQPEIDPEDPYGWRQKLEDIANRQLDPEAAEERIARQRAAQEASIRATMGAGEAGRSGAAALLGGEAGRMAESQARSAELARELDVAELGSVLMNFDTLKDRYNDAEKRQAASAAMYLAMAYDVDYDEAFAMLNLPDSAKSDEAREAFEGFIQDLDGDDDDEEGEEEETEKTGAEKTEEIKENLEEIYGDNTYGTESFDQSMMDDHSYMYNDQVVLDGRKIDLPQAARPTGRTKRFNGATHTEYEFWDANKNDMTKVWYRE